MPEHTQEWCTTIVLLFPRTCPASDTPLFGPETTSLRLNARCKGPLRARVHGIFKPAKLPRR